MKDNLGLQQYATANDVMEKLVEDYDLASFPLSWQRTLGGIHYEMQLQAFSNVNNFIMAENVSEATVATIKGAQPLAAGCGDRGKRVPAAMSNPRCCPMCWAGWARSPPKVEGDR